MNLSLSDLEDTGLEPLLDWDEHRSLLLDLLADISTKPFVGTKYFIFVLPGVNLGLAGVLEKLPLLAGLHSLVVCGQEHVLQVTAKDLNIFRLAPTIQELEVLRVCIRTIASFRLFFRND